jgi:hypothetical protein
MLRFHLPPNLTAAAARDAVPIRVEVDVSAPPSPDILPALALLQRWCGTTTPPKFIQLSRAQLRDLAAAAGTQAIFVENGQSSTWRHPGLLAPPTPANAGSGPSPRASANRPTSNAFRTPSRPPGPAAPPLIVDGSEHFLALMLPSREHPR